MAEETLKQKTAKGLFWGLVNNGTQQLLNLLFGIFLARLLTPADYGMVGMLSVFSFVASSLQESGFTSALANKKDVKHEDYNAVFWFSISMSFLLYWLLFFSAPLIAGFYGKPELIPLGRYSFLGFFVSSMGIAPSAYLFRNMLVRQRARASVVGLFCSGIVGILLAYCGYSYWGIATQTLVYISMMTLLVWIACPWHPTIKIDFSPLKQMIGFGSRLLFTNVFNHINNNLFSIVLGRFYTEKEVGQFNQANKWNYMGHSLISGMVGSVAQPMFAQIREDDDRQVRAFRKMLRFTSFISFPAMFGLSLVAPELITIAITDKWIVSAHILQILAINGAFIPVITLYTQLLISKGKSNVYMWNTIAIGIIQLLLLLILYPYGIFAMVTIYATVNILWLFVWHYFVWKEIRIPLYMVLKDILPFACISLFVMAITYVATSSLQNIYLLALSKIALAAFLYILIMLLFGSVTFKECLSYILSKRKRR